MEPLLDLVVKTSADSYPPYNIERVGDNHLRITLAVAGFAADDLGVVVADNQLLTRGHQKPMDDLRMFLHRGIAVGQFQRAFVFTKGMESRARKRPAAHRPEPLCHPKPVMRYPQALFGVAVVDILSTRTTEPS